MEMFPKYITINNQNKEVDKLIDETKKYSEYEKKIYYFVKEWYNSNDYIEVKTSGSTGTPKNIKLKKEFVAKSAKRTISYFKLKNNDTILNCLPVDYIAGKLMVVRAIIGKLNMLIVDPATDFIFLSDKKIHFAAMVPHQVNKLLKHQNNKLLQNINNLLIGGSAIPKQLEKKLYNLSINYYASYAMTETATHIALRKINKPGESEFYKCFNDINVDISKDNRLQIFMPELKKNPLQTNDLAQLTDNKTFKIIGRADNVIISGGIKYSPEVIEVKLQKYLTNLFIISSIPHPSLGQQIILIIEEKKSENKKILLESIIKKYLKKFEQPRKIFFVDELPKTENKKIDRNKARELILK